MAPFFPNPVLGWTFFTVLIAPLSMAAVIDLRRGIVPKWLSLPTLALGVTANVVRGAWLGGEGHEVWKFGASGPWAGAADGFLFSLAGFATGFAIFFFLWTAGGCGGGDVKLFAATSAWVGPWIAVWLLTLSTIILIVLVTLRGAIKMLSPSPDGGPTTVDKRKKAAKPGAPRTGRGMTYSLPLALATALVLLWFFRFDLNLAQPRSLNESVQAKSV